MHLSIWRPEILQDGKKSKMKEDLMHLISSASIYVYISVITSLCIHFLFCLLVIFMASVYPSTRLIVWFCFNPTVHSLRRLARYPLINLSFQLFASISNLKYLLIYYLYTYFSTFRSIYLSIHNYNYMHKRAFPQNCGKWP